MITTIKHKKINIVVIATLLMTMLSCKKELENRLINKTYADSFWKSQGDVNGALAGAYGLFRTSLNQNSCFFMWGDAPAGVMTSSGTSNSTGVLTGGFKMPYRETGTTNWTNWYRVIDLSNLIIENIAKMPNESFASVENKNYLLGEAYFLRGLSYFYMTRVWGDVPLMLKATTTADQAVLIPATNADDILNQVIADGKKASSLLTWEGATTYQKRRANKGAALALLAHATAWKNDYQSTALYTDSIISTTSQFNLQASNNISAVFKNSNEPENIFVLTAKDSENESAEWDSEKVSVFTANIAYVTIGSDILKGMPISQAEYYPDSVQINLLYDKNTDVRVNQFFKRSSTGKKFWNLWKYGNIVFKNGTTDPRAESNLVIFRLADIILLKAEALNFLNRDAEALVELNKIRTRAQATAISSSGDNLKRDILLERQRELTGEGQNYYDIVRTKYFSLLPWTMSQERIQQKGFYWPLSNDVLNANRLIDQVPYWNGR